MSSLLHAGGVGTPRDDEREHPHRDVVVAREDFVRVVASPGGVLLVARALLPRAHRGEVAAGARDHEIGQRAPLLGVADDEEAPGLCTASGRCGERQPEHGVEDVLRHRCVRVVAYRPPLRMASSTFMPILVGSPAGVQLAVHRRV